MSQAPTFPSAADPLPAEPFHIADLADAPAPAWIADLKFFLTAYVLGLIFFLWLLG